MGPKMIGRNNEYHVEYLLGLNTNLCLHNSQNLGQKEDNKGVYSENKSTLYI